MHPSLLPLILILLQVSAGPPHRNDGRAATGLTSPDHPTMTGTISSCSLWYTVQSGDSCSSVEKTFGITHSQFLSWNPAVSQDCATNFWADESYCVGVSLSTAPSTTSSATEKTSAPSVTKTTLSCPDKPTMTGIVSNCNAWYDIVSGDDCDSVPAAFNITREQFLEWNPAVSSDCATNFWENEAYCVGTGTAAQCTPPQAPFTTARNTTSGPHTTTPSRTYSPLSYTTTDYTPAAVDTAWPPSKTQEGQPSYCNKWHRVRRGDTCESIRSRYSRRITVQDVLAWNPTLGEDCSGLYVNWWVCVGIQPQTSFYNTEVYTSTYEPWTPTPLPSVDFSFNPSPTQSGIPEGCQAFYEAKADDTCSDITSRLGFMTDEQLHAWNPTLGADCSGLIPGYYYCVASFTALPLPPMVTATPTATQSGIASNCKGWYQATELDDCDSFPLMFPVFTKEEFLSWNPALKSDCSGLIVGNYYCVAIPDTATTQTKYTYSSLTFPTATEGGPQPQQTGITNTCTKYWFVGVNDNCTTIADVNSITESELISWNPAVKADCSGLSSDYYVCVKVASSTTTSNPMTTPAITPSSSTIPVTSSAGGVSTPSPVQSGMASGCRRFYHVQKGDTCYDIAIDAGVELSDFYSWNLAVGEDCSDLETDTFVCIGVAGTATTITSGTPVPT